MTGHIRYFLVVNTIYDSHIVTHLHQNLTCQDIFYFLSKMKNSCIYVTKCKKYLKSQKIYKPKFCYRLVAVNLTIHNINRSVTMIRKICQNYTTPRFHQTRATNDAILFVCIRFVLFLRKKRIWTNVNEYNECNEKTTT